MCEPVLDKLEKSTGEKKKASEIKIQLYVKELEFIEAELCLEEVMEDLDEELKVREKEEENLEMDLQEDKNSSVSVQQEEKSFAKDEEEEEDVTPSSFGSVTQDEDPTKNDGKGNRSVGAPFSTSSLSFASCSLLSTVPSRLQLSFLAWKNRLPQKAAPSLCVVSSNDPSGMFNLVSFPPVLGRKGWLRIERRSNSIP